MDIFHTTFGTIQHLKTIYLLSCCMFILSEPREPYRLVNPTSYWPFPWSFIKVYKNRNRQVWSFHYAWEYCQAWDLCAWYYSLTALWMLRPFVWNKWALFFKEKVLLFAWLYPMFLHYKIHIRNKSYWQFWAYQYTWQCRDKFGWSRGC